MARLSEVPAETLAPLFERMIRDGKFDERLNDLIDVTVARKRLLKDQEVQRLRRSIKIGDEVKVLANIKPRYMANRVGKVKAIISPFKVEVDFGGPVGRFGSVVRIPLAALTLVKAAVPVPEIEVTI